MSGGAFDYQQYHLGNMAQELQHHIDTNDSVEKDEFGQMIGKHYPPEIMQRFRQTVLVLQRASDMMHEVDWLLSGDTGPETFMQTWKEKRLDHGIKPIK